jgi:hypothetical protein
MAATQGGKERCKTDMVKINNLEVTSFPVQGLITGGRYRHSKDAKMISCTLFSCFQAQTNYR